MALQYFLLATGFDSETHLYVLCNGNERWADAELGLTVQVNKVKETACYEIRTGHLNPHTCDLPMFVPVYEDI